MDIKSEPDYKGTNNALAPYGKCPELRERIKKFAEDNNLVVSKFAEHKIKFSEVHRGVCFCDPLRRLHCPCDEIWSDFKRFGNRCLCRLFWKPEAYAKWLKTKEKQKTLSDVKVEKVEKTKEEKLKEKEIVQNVWKNLQ